MVRRPTRSALVVLTLALAGCATSATTFPGEDVGTPPPVRPGTTTEALVALDDDGVTELDPDTGEVVERHDVDPGDGLVDLEHVPTRGVALVTRRVGGDDAELVEVALDGTGTRERHLGAHPAVTGNGSRLAYTRHTEATDRLELVVAADDGTELEVWPAHTAGPETLQVTSLSWDPSGDRLAFLLRTSTGDEVRVLPIQRGGSLRGASHVVAPTSVGARLTAPVFHTSGTLTVAEGCCEADDHATWRLLDVTVEAGTTRALVTGIDGPVSHLDWSADGERLAMTLDRNAVARWDRTSGFDRLAEGVRSAEF